MPARIWAIVATGMLAAAMPAARAETLYVIEQLYVTVNASPDGTGERVGQIKSGDAVELIERQDGQAHVRLASGTEGWVKASYLSPEPPLREQVAARTAELEQVRKEKAQLEAELSKTRTALAAANASIKAAAHEAQGASSPGSGPSDAAAAEVAGVRGSGNPAAAHDAASVADPGSAAGTGTPVGSAALEAAAQTPPPLFQDEPLMPARPSWWAATVVALITLAVGFALGWWILDRRIRAKYGGLRIY
ncbi:MAG TPA: TIGR04211 family SH3 domain-containing protein [Steroidobacteraceae bacterium]|nr:TIGR04211 family SH3 domain-containing protein [Steroidobacteraceae bacterium]